MLKRKWVETQKYILFFSTLLAVFLIGFFGGIVNEKIEKSKAAPGFELSRSPSPEIPLLILEKIENGILYGMNDGSEIRIIVGEGKEEIHPLPDGSFSFSIVSILPNLQMIPAPEGMLFVASKNGKKYYPLDAPEADMLSPKNRIFFSSREEAESAGYVKGG